MKGVFALVASREVRLSAGRKIVFLLTLFLATSAIVLAQAPAEPAGAPEHNFYLVDGAGGSVVNGPARNMTGAGGVFVAGVGWYGRSRLSYPINFLISYNNVPTAVLKQANQNKGDEDFLVLGIDPTLALFRAGHWGAYLSGGAGLSWKNVRFLVPEYDSDYGYGYYGTSESEWSFQPALDADAGLTYAFHRGSGMQMFLEMRYLEMFTPQRQSPGFASAGTGLLLPSIGLRFQFGGNRGNSVRPQ